MTICQHPEESRLGFFPGSTDGGHERCLDCDGIRYQQRRDGPWWPWGRQVSVEEEEEALAKESASPRCTRGSMGSFDYSCSISGLPIGWQTPVRFMVLAQKLGYRRAIPHDVDGRWQPLAPPIRARYNSYGSVEFDEGREVDALFDILNRRAVERDVGESPRRDMAVTRGMPREDWLTALWLGRVEVETPRGKAEVAQTMIREDIWVYLTETHGMIGPQPPEWRYVDSGMRLETALEAEVLRDSACEAALRELYAVTHALKRLGRPWTPGTCCGPQDGLWDFHQRFAQKIATIATEAIARYTDD